MLPLANRRILVTRAAGQASALATQLEALGATTILIPTIELAPPASYEVLDAALRSIGTFDWLIFTSANAVQAFAARARALMLQPQARCVAAIGPATAKAVVEAGIAAAVDLVPPQAIAESLAESLLPHAPNASMLLVRAVVARDILPETLRAAGATVAIAEAYRTIVPESSVDQLRELFSTNPPDAITFTSASTAQNLVALLDASSIPMPDGIVLASIGPITSNAMRDLGLRPTVEAEGATIPALVAALNAYLSG